MDRDNAATRTFCSWSGGKDSALALHRAVLAGCRPELLVTMMTETGQRSRSHGLRRALLERQAAAMGLPIHFGSATWDGYEAEFGRAVEYAVGAGAATGVFGDIDTESHRRWVRTVCARGGAEALLPLWGRDRAGLLRELLASGFRALVVAVRDGVLPRQVLGSVVDDAFLATVAAAGADLAGENGEYHTVVIDGPIFRHPLQVRLGDTSLRDGVWFIDVDPDDTAA